MDEMPSDLTNNIMGNEEKVKKKRKRKKNMNLHELAESSKVQTEKHNEKKHKKRELENVSLQTPTSKKKKRKLNEGGEVVISGEASVMDDGVTSLHQVKDLKAPTAESQELQGEKPAKTKKKRANVTETNCDDMAQEEQAVMTTEPEEVPYMSHQESGHTAILAGTRKWKKKKRFLDAPLFDPNLLDELKEICPNIESRDLHNINQMILHDLPRLKEFKKQGIMFKNGRFTHSENERLRKNVRDFMALTGVKDATKLFHPKRFPEERRELAKLKKDYSFFERIGRVKHLLCVCPPRNCSGQPETETNAERTTVNPDIINSFKIRRGLI